jgi:hypothetical protein
MHDSAVAEQARLVAALAKRARNRGLRFSVGAPSSSLAVSEVERRLGVELPANARRFYEAHDGLIVAEPALAILSLGELALAAPHRLRFAIFDGVHDVCFDTSTRNQADEWSIVGPGDHVITLTWGSFCANKIFKWIDGRHPVWELPVGPRLGA